MKAEDCCASRSSVEEALCRQVLGDGCQGPERLGSCVHRHTAVRRLCSRINSRKVKHAANAHEQCSHLGHTVQLSGSFVCALLLSLRLHPWQLKAVLFAQHREVAVQVTARQGVRCKSRRNRNPKPALPALSQAHGQPRHCSADGSGAHHFPALVTASYSGWTALR